MEKTLSKPLEVKHIVHAARESVTYIDKRRKGEINSLRTPWEKYNRVAMGGIEWWTIHTIAGMSGSGKTAIINQLETSLDELNPKEEFNILSFNFEMLARNLVARKFANKLNLTTQDLLSGNGESLSDEDYNKVLSTGKDLSVKNIFYVEKTGTVEQIEKTIFSFVSNPNNRGKGTIVMLDHTILVTGRAGAKEREILVDLMTMFNGLKKICHESGIKVAFVILSQLNGDIERADRQSEPTQQFPKKRDLFGSSAVFMFSDVVMVSMNPELMGLEAYGPKRWPVEGILYWHFLKVREGSPIVAGMKNVLKYSRVEDYVRE